MGVKQFAGSLRVTSATTLQAGKQFQINLEIKNTGLFPWIEGDGISETKPAGLGVRIELKGEAEQLELASTWNCIGEPMVWGDQRTITLKGTAPNEPGKVELTFELVAPLRDRWVFTRQRVKLTWKRKPTD